MTKYYRNDIQVLRGVAVVAVLVFHAFENIFPLGYLGVDIFFVISGFVVTPLILRIHDEKFLNWMRELKRFYIKNKDPNLYNKGSFFTCFFLVYSFHFY